MHCNNKAVVKQIRLSVMIIIIFQLLVIELIVKGDLRNFLRQTIRKK